MTLNKWVPWGFWLQLTLAFTVFAGEAQEIRREQREAIEKASTLYSAWMERVSFARQKLGEWQNNEKEAIGSLNNLPAPAQEIAAYIDNLAKQASTSLIRFAEDIGSAFNEDVRRANEEAQTRIHSGRRPTWRSRSMEALSDRWKSLPWPGNITAALKPITPKQIPVELFKVDRPYTLYWMTGNGFINDRVYCNNLKDRIVRLLAGGPVEGNDLEVSSEGHILLRGYKITPVFYVNDKGKSLPLSQVAPDGYKKILEELHELGLDYSAKISQKVLRKEIAQFANQRQFRNPEPPNLYITESAQLVPIPTQEKIHISDRFDRDLRSTEIHLLDWEGYLANPAFQIKLTRSADQPPTRVVLESNDPRLYFNSPAGLSARGSKKAIHLTAEKPGEKVYLAIWPDRDDKNETHKIDLSYWASEPKDERDTEIPRHATTISLTVNVIDRDPPQKGPQSPMVLPASTWPALASPKGEPRLNLPFPYLESEFKLPLSQPFSIALDFTLDKTGFLSSDEELAQQRRQILQQAADDWSFFISQMKTDPVYAGSEKNELFLSVGQGANNQTTRVENRYAYSGSSIYVLGANSADRPNSRGGARGSGFHYRYGRTLDLRRSGQVIIEGANHPEHFLVDPSEKLWWQAVYDVLYRPLDLYTVGIHEFGHVLLFDHTFKVAEKWLDKGLVSDLVIEDYNGGEVKLDSSSHFSNEIDRETLWSPFGSLSSRMPKVRWLLTPLDLLALRAAGYELNPHTALQPMQWREDYITTFYSGRRNEYSFQVSGGIPPYYWKVEKGSLPGGLYLDSFSGILQGTAKTPGEYHAIISVVDSSNQDRIPLQRHYRISVTN